MAQLLSSNWVHADDWIDAAIETSSVPLLHRVMIALKAVRASDQNRAEWAHVALTERIQPALEVCLEAGLSG